MEKSNTEDKEEIVGVSEITLNKTEMSLVTGAGESLVSTIIPSNATNKNVEWTSSNPKIATVDKFGKVTAISAGSATITVKTKDGSKIATCKVIVKNPIVINDTSTHWAKDEIDIAVTYGLVNGFNDNTFRPDEPITREQVAKIISNYKKLEDNNFDKLNKYKDAVNVSSWAKYSVECVLEKGYMNGYTDNTFRPKNNITRAEAVVTLSRITK